MKIGIFGNTNNYPLLLAMALRRLGHDTVLLVNRTERLHRPESRDEPLASGYPAWIVDCSSIAEEEFVAATPRIDPVLDLLGRCDALILNDLGPSLLPFCPKPALAFLTGSDLTYYADPATTSIRHAGWSEAYARTPGARLWTERWNHFIARQRQGIREAAAVSAPRRGLVPTADSLLDDIGVADTRREFLYLADTAHAPAPPRRPERRLRIVNGARLNWKMPLPAGFCSLDHKGTDVLLEGFCQFVRSGGDAELVLFRKGLHIGETQALVSSLGLDDHVQWKDEATLREFYQEISDADIVCDQLGQAFPGMAAVDAMAIGLPVIANFRPEILAGHFPTPIAACQAQTAGEVTAHLHALASSPRARVTAGRAARHFARTHLSPEANARRCLAHLGVP